MTPREVDATVPAWALGLAKRLGRIENALREAPLCEESAA